MYFMILYFSNVLIHELSIHPVSSTCLYFMAVHGQMYIRTYSIVTSDFGICNNYLGSLSKRGYSRAPTLWIWRIGARGPTFSKHSPTKVFLCKWTHILWQTVGSTSLKWLRCWSFLTDWWGKREKKSPSGLKFWI